MTAVPKDTLLGLIRWTFIVALLPLGLLGKDIPLATSSLVHLTFDARQIQNRNELRSYFVGDSLPLNPRALFWLGNHTPLWKISGAYCRFGRIWFGARVASPDAVSCRFKPLGLYCYVLTFYPGADILMSNADPG
jgi:hypothetical protein